MLRLICGKKGITMVEVLIAIFLTTTGILALLALHDTGWKTMARADYVGRASGILNKTLENSEMVLLNPCNDIPSDSANIIVYPSGGSSQISGDVAYSVDTSYTKLDTIANVPCANVLVSVTVKWPPVNNIGIQETMTVKMQETYRYPAGCANATR